MVVRISNALECALPTEEFNFIKFSIDFCVNRFNLSNHQIFVFKLSNDSLFSGLCDYTPNCVNFGLKVDNWHNFNHLLETLCHEFVHVKQYCNKEMIDVKNGVVFNGIFYSFKNTDYENRPWEEEAYKLQTVLYNELIAAYIIKEAA